MPWHTLTRSTPQDPFAEFALDVLTGLSEHRKKLSSKWFYDDAGSALFQAIMALDEYYPTDCERQIFERQGAEIAARFAGKELDVVDLGAGDGTKTSILLGHLRDAGVRLRYVPVDISEGAMQSLEQRMATAHVGMELQGVVGEYVPALRWLRSESDRPRLVLFLGSNIGNFDKPRARGFLRRIWSGLAPGDHMLVGFDMKKDIEVLLAAYNDSHGATRDFNLNLLTRINRELGGHFDLDQWRHYGTYNVFTGAMESYLVSLVRQEVRIDALRQSFVFQSWEPVHTEYSYKYQSDDLDSLARTTGFELCARYTDERDWFTDALWRVA